MATLTETQLATARLELGTTIDEDDLQTRYNRTQSLDVAVGEVLQQRLADLRATPASFNTPDYGQSTSDNIKSLELQVSRRHIGSVVRVISPPDRPAR